MQTNEVKISIIMPSLNVKEFISQCIESVINQTLTDIEIICVDAGSNDGTLEILEKYCKKDSRIKILHSDKKSYGYQMNLAISNACGQYIGIVETDDFIDEKMYETLYELTDNGTTDISKVNFYHYYGDDFKSDESKKNLPLEKFTVYDYPNILKGHPSIWAAIYKKSFLEETNIKFMEAPGGGWVDNPFLFQTMLSAKSITYKDEAFYYYRELNPNSSTNDMKDLTLAMERMMDNLDVLEDYSCDDERILTELYIRIFWHINDILNKENFNQQKDEVLKYFYKVLIRLDEEIISNNFSLRNRKLYYKFSSPLHLYESNNNDEVTITKDEMDNILRENKFLYSEISRLESENKKLKRKNKKLSNNNKKKESEKNSDSKLSKFVRKIKKH